jgi:hypothetical protein
MKDAEKEQWADFKGDLPWLNSSHRVLLRTACVLAVRMDEGEVGVQAIMALSSILSKLGATPVDETKVNHQPPENDDPADKFFGRPH